jgi:hypothetical protein
MAATRPFRLAFQRGGLLGRDGFTTVIIQALTLTGGPAANTIVNYPTFGAIDGVLPTFVIGLNANSPSPGQGQGQWLVKYELPGNRDVYSLSISLVNAGGPQVPLTISKFEVDTFYSATVFAMDDAQAVPEPTTVTLTIIYSRHPDRLVQAEGRFQNLPQLATGVDGDRANSS